MHAEATIAMRQGRLEASTGRGQPGSHAQTGGVGRRRPWCGRPHAGHAAIRDFDHHGVLWVRYTYIAVLRSQRSYGSAPCSAPLLGPHPWMEMAVQLQSSSESCTEFGRVRHSCKAGGRPLCSPMAIPCQRAEPGCLGAPGRWMPHICVATAAA